MLTAISIFFGSIPNDFEKLARSIQNGTYSRGSCILRAGTLLFVVLSVSIRSMVMSTSRKLNKVTGDWVCAGVVNLFANRTVACHSPSRSYFFDDSMLDFLDRSLSQSRTGTSAKCIGTIFLSLGKSPLLHRSMHLALRKMSTAGFWIQETKYVLVGLPSLRSFNWFLVPWLNYFETVQNLGHQHA